MWWARAPVRDVALDSDPVGALDGSEPVSDPCLAGGDGLAVASAVGAFGQAFAVPRDFADVGFALVGVSGDGEQGGVGGVGVQDETDGLAVGFRWARAMMRGPPVSGQACSGRARPSRARSWSLASITSAWSIWSQALPKFSLIGPRSVPRPMQYSSSLAACDRSV
jgi:hypothetical protein